MKVIERFYKHIDNGGVLVSVEHTTDEYKQLVIRIMTSYFGYPSLESAIYSYGYLGSKDLQEIGLMFLKAAEEYKIIETELKENNDG